MRRTALARWLRIVRRAGADGDRGDRRGRDGIIAALAAAAARAAEPADNMTSGHPTTTEVRVELEDLGGRTKMLLTHVGIPAESPGAAGWKMAFDKLDALAAAQRGK